MKISERGRKIPASSIRKLIPYADAAKARGIHVYHLNIGQPDIRTPDTFMDAIIKYPMEVLAYGPSNGIREYRQKLAEYYRNWKINVDENQVFVTTAGSEALLFSIAAVADSGDSILVMEPFYTNYNGFAAMLDVEVVGIPTLAENGFDIPPISEFEKRCDERTRAIVLCNPNNPTGAVYSRESLEKLASFAVRKGLFVISDEVYREFTYDGLESVSVMDLPNIDEHAIVVDSVSKRFSACGARIGCIVTKNRGVLDTVMRMGQARLCPPTLEQIGSMGALNTPSQYMEDVIKEYEYRRDILFEGLNAIEGVFCEKPRGAFYMMVSLPVDDADKFAQFMLEDFSVDNKTVMVAPGSGFYATPGMGLNQVRMAYVLKAEDLVDSLKILEKGLSAYNDR